MYRKQLAIQKAICLLSVITGAIIFVYSLGIMTDLYDSLYKTMMNPRDLTQTMVPGSYVYYEMQDFNQMLLKVAIGLILVSLLLYITNTHTRRRYYIGNFVAIIVNVGCTVAAAVWAHSQIEIYKAKFLEVDFEALATFAKSMRTLYTESTFALDIHYAIFGFALLVACLHVVNLVWKLFLMHEEARLVRGAKKVSFDPAEELTAIDRMRYEKNKLSSRLAILAIVFNGIYFVSIYRSNVGSYYYMLLLGASILYNLIFMLVVFLASEGAKNYKAMYSPIMIIIGLLQIVRIFILPLRAHTTTVTVSGTERLAMKTGQFIWVICLLVASAICCIACGITLNKKSRELNEHLANLK